jgi:hypothetical protein
MSVFIIPFYIDPKILLPHCGMKLDYRHITMSPSRYERITTMSRGWTWETPIRRWPVLERGEPFSNRRQDLQDGINQGCIGCIVDLAGLWNPTLLSLIIFDNVFLETPPNHSPLILVEMSGFEDL